MTTVGVRWSDEDQDFLEEHKFVNDDIEGDTFISYSETTYGPRLASSIRTYIYSPIETLSLCSIQLFGYNSCEFTIDAGSTTTVTWAIGTTQNVDHSHSFMFNFEVPNAGVYSHNSTICQYGLAMYQECTECQDGEVLPF